MNTQKQEQNWNTGATEIQQLNPGGPDQRQGIEPTTRLIESFRKFSKVWIISYILKDKSNAT